jgi:hypothetical protein
VAGKSTSVEVGETSFDVAGIGAWISDNIWLFMLLVFIAFIFHIFSKGGFAEKLLEYRFKGRELDAKQLDDARRLADTFAKKYDRDDPLLPFDSGLNE